MIQGNFLTNELFNSLSEEQKHSIDYNELDLKSINPILWYENLYKREKEICFKYFMKNKYVRWLNYFF